MPFEFIDNTTAIDRTSRKRIRSHVATGKNANKTLTRPSKALALKDSSAAAPFHVPSCLRKTQAQKSQEEKNKNTRESASSSRSNVEIEIGIDRQWDDGLLFPVPVRGESRYLVHQAIFFFCGIKHNPDLDGALVNPDHTSSVWVRYIFLDEAYFHCSLATSILCHRNHRNETTQGMHHIARTYRIIQKRLCGNEATSDMTIAILVVMSQYERLQGQYARGYIHVKGLRRMVELRGGVVRLSRECWRVMQKVLRADLEYALQLGTRTLFGVEGIEALRTSGCVYVDGGKGGELGSGLALDSFLQGHLRDELWMVFSDMRYLGMVIYDAIAGYRQRMDGIEFHSSILLLGHRLLHINPLGEGEDSGTCADTGLSELENAVHLGLVAFLATFLTGLDHRVLDKPLLSRRLRLAVENLSSSIEAGEGSRFVQNVRIWILYIGVVGVFKPADDEWLIPTTEAAMQSLGLVSWEDVKKTVAGFPWVNVLHDRAGIALCSAQRMLEFSNKPDQLP
ncbi:hypothetical protein BDW59DRAFT_94644 [Aspergillus cavernicola]|uniref:Fungal-specific transcription factor domain-containing protein n=1 Tax=Aspergillus cavernicola TaxID=176166 RepID=A0ABR4IYZ9_9EURO